MKIVCPQFIGEIIRVITGGTVKQPLSFTWRNTDYRVTEVLLSWVDWGFPQGATQRGWRTRRHRNYFRVQTDSGETFEIYLDRGSSKHQGEWYLFRQLD